MILLLNCNDTVLQDPITIMKVKEHKATEKIASLQIGKKPYLSALHLPCIPVAKETLHQEALFFLICLNKSKHHCSLIKMCGEMLKIQQAMEMQQIKQKALIRKTSRRICKHKRWLMLHSVHLSTLNQTCVGHHAGSSTFAFANPPFSSCIALHFHFKAKLVISKRMVL